MSGVSGRRRPPSTVLVLAASVIVAGVVAGLVTAWDDDGGGGRERACGELQPVADALAAVAREVDGAAIDLDGEAWDGLQLALARADDVARDSGDPVLARAVYRAREQAARADAAGRGDPSEPGHERGQEQFRVHLVEAGGSLGDAVHRCRRFDHDVRWRELD